MGIWRFIFIILFVLAILIIINVTTMMAIIRNMHCNHSVPFSVITAIIVVVTIVMINIASTKRIMNIKCNRRIS